MSNLTVHEAARRLRVSEDTVRRMVRIAQTKVIRAGKQTVIPEANLNRIADNYTRQLKRRARR